MGAKYLVFLLSAFLSHFSLGEVIDSAQIEKEFNLANVGNAALHPSPNLLEKLEKELAKKPLEGYLYYNWSLFMYYQSNLDSALHVAETGVKKCGQRANQKVFKNKLLNLVASFHLTKQEFPEAINYFQQALTISEELKDINLLAKINSNMANLFFSLLDYNKAYKHALLAYKNILPYPSDPSYANIISILAVSESKLGKNEAGMYHAKLALKAAEVNQNPVATLIANHSLGEIYLNNGNATKAKEFFETSLELSEKMMNGNFMILNDIGLLNTNLILKNYKAAIDNGEQALGFLKQDSDKTRIYTVKRKLAEAYQKTGQFEKAYQLMAQAHQNYVAKNGLDKQKSINELMVKFETQKKEKQLVQNKLKLVEKESALRKTWLYSVLISVLTLFSLTFLFFIRYRNRKRLELFNKQRERQVIEAVMEGEENERERLSIELHDGLASDLTAARYKLASIETDQKNEIEQLTTLLQTAHEDTRRMSHRLAPMKLYVLGLVEALKQFASDCSSDQRRVIFTDLTNHAKISKEKSIILYRVGQELVQNAIKHAEAAAISIQLSVESDSFSLLVEDNGIGFDVNKKTTTNGLQSLKKRADQMDGAFQIDSNPGIGTIAIFKIPLT